MTVDEVPPCGHVPARRGCGGCDPGAVEWVKDDGAPWRRPDPSETTLTFPPERVPAGSCPDRDTHRGPEGPNEDLGVCPKCWWPTYSVRPAGETFGSHAADCSLPADHASFCAPGGSGHPPAAKVRG